MAKNKGPRLVQCYHCRHRFEVGGRAQSTSCPGCNKPLIVEDLVIDKLKAGLIELRTCGSITVKKKGRIMADRIEAHGWIVCYGIIEAKKVVSGQTVVLAKSATYRGDLEAPAVEMALGAKVKPSQFAVPSDPLGLGDLGEEKLE
ncbi:MAG: polymer-forming cytoskeletal protein [Phycisphaeraceae bacterium]|nr:polymer-forming cytoskeletal protein [Phycisphaeraceae bacterium]